MELIITAICILIVIVIVIATFAAGIVAELQ